MKKYRFALFFILISFSACNSGTEENQKSSESRLTSVFDSLGQAILDEGKVLGFSISIDSAGKTIYNGNFGFIDAEKTKPVTRETRFDIASVSKFIGVSVIMKLAEEGKLNLDQTMDELLPEFPEPEQAKRITLRHLISHTSGLQDYALEIDSVFNQTGIVPEKQDFLNFFRGKDLLFEPGTNYQYCNSGFMIMAFIAQNVTDQTWQQLLDTIINPSPELDFQLIKYATDLPQTSPIFDLEEGNFKKVPTWVYVIGDGGLTATSEVLSKFPSIGSTEGMLERASFLEMITPKMLHDKTYTGYGFGVRNGSFLGEPMFGHTGGWKSTYAIMSHFPERNLTFAGLMNTDGTSTEMTSIFASYITLLLDKPFPEYTGTGFPIANPTRFAGEYYGYDKEFDNKGSTVTVKLTEDNRLLYCLDESCEPLVHLGENKFWMAAYPYDFIEFQSSEKGDITALREYYYGFFQVLRIRVHD